MLLAAAVVVDGRKSSLIYKVSAGLHCLPVLDSVDAAGMHFQLSLGLVCLPSSACFLAF